MVNNILKFQPIKIFIDLVINNLLDFKNNYNQSYPITHQCDGKIHITLLVHFYKLHYVTKFHNDLLWMLL